MPAKSLKSRVPAYGRILSTDEILELAGAERYIDACSNLRMGGGVCVACNSGIADSDDASMLVHVTATVCIIEFAHARCLPPQVLDNRRNRRVSTQLERYLEKRSQDVSGFLAFREDRAPHAMLVVSTEVVISGQIDGDDLVNGWIDHVLGEGLLLSGPDPLGTDAPIIEGWEVKHHGRRLWCGAGSFTLYEGEPPTFPEWIDAVRAQGTCLVLVAGLNLVSDELGGATEAALRYLAQRGLLALGIARTAVSGEG